MADLTGQRLGQYQILARINKGTTSTIYKAYQPKLDRFVAIKVLSPQVVDEEGFLDRFTQEARAVAQLDHPNIVPVYDFDQVGDIAYIVFKYVEGGTLRSMMTGTPMSLGMAVDIVTQVGLALGYAHKRGIIHRDVKPSNILIGEGCWALLTDFGLAKILGGGRKLTRSGIGMGTPDYMAPEQAQGITSDGRADLYSLGVVLYEMVAGRLPFEADSSMAVVVKHITEPPPTPRNFVPDLPIAVENLILTALNKDPEQRFKTAEAMVTALVRGTGQQQHATAPEADLAALRVARSTARPIFKGLSAQVRQSWQRTKTVRWGRFSQRSRMVLGGAILLVMALAVILGSLALRHPATLAVMFSTEMPIRPLLTTISTPPALTSMPPSRQTDTLTLTPAISPEWILLPVTAKIKPGIYVRAVKPEGVILRRGAGFDSDYITTLPVDQILYVNQGPILADDLMWLSLSASTWTGWARQDEVVPYGIKAKPTP